MKARRVSIALRTLLVLVADASVWGQATTDLGGPGPYQAGRSEVTVTRADGSTFGAALFYPATAPGTSAPFDGAGAPYPAVAFGHGFLQPVEQYQSTLAHLATWGYLVIAPRSGSELFPSHQQFAGDLRQCLTFLEQENVRAGAMLRGGVNTLRFGMSGHSMGGGASILATSADARVKALANLAAAETNPSAIAAMANVRVPVSLISGAQDTIVPPGTNGLRMYQAGAAPRQLPLIQGGFHCGFTDGTFLFCDSGSISRAQQLATTRRLLTTFFNLYLKGDQDLWTQVWGPSLNSDPGVYTEADPGIVLTPGETLISGRAGTIIEAHFALSNTGPQTTAFTLLITGNLWQAVPFPGVLTLAPGEQAPIRLQLALPAQDAAAQGLVIVSARSERDGGTRGFAVVLATRLARADFNLDGGVASDDFEIFRACVTGPGVAYFPSPPAACALGLTDGVSPADFDADGDVDHDDFGVFQRCTSGAAPAFPNCAE